jgi:glycosyltransferase involved in cell wall biosynthesis
MSRGPRRATEMTRVLHIITRMDVGGSSDDTLILVTRMQPPEFDTALISGPTPDPVPGLKESLTGAGVPWIHVPSLRRPVNVPRDLLALRDLRHRIRGLQPDIVHTHSSKAGFVGRLAARLAGVRRIFYTPHGHVFHSYYGRPVTRMFVHLERFAARFTERIVVLTDAEAEQHLAVGVGRREQFVTIPSGVDLSHVRAEAAGASRLRQDLGLPPATPLIGSVARLVPIKGLRHLVAAMPEVLRHCPDTHLILAGDGDQRPGLEALARDLAAADRVHFLGFRRDAAAVTAALDVFVLPSLNEGQGRVLVTAMALGIPVVATRVGGVPEVVEDGRQGVLVPPAEPEALGQAVVRLLRDRQHARSLGAEGRARALLFSSEVMVKRHAELYRSASR